MSMAKIWSWENVHHNLSWWWSLHGNAADFLGNLPFADSSENPLHSHSNTLPGDFGVTALTRVFLYCNIDTFTWVKRVSSFSTTVFLNPFHLKPRTKENLEYVSFIFALFSPGQSEPEGTKWTHSVHLFLWLSQLQTDMGPCGPGGPAWGVHTTLIMSN